MLIWPADANTDCLNRESPVRKEVPRNEDLPESTLEKGLTMRLGDCLGCERGVDDLCRRLGEADDKILQSVNSSCCCFASASRSGLGGGDVAPFGRGVSAELVLPYLEAGLWLAVSLLDGEPRISGSMLDSREERALACTSRASLCLRSRPCRLKRRSQHMARQRSNHRCPRTSRRKSSVAHDKPRPRCDHTFRRLTSLLPRLFVLVLLETFFD